ncbi:MAG: HEPN domain-containing protein [Gaiellaceae bacterium MAG52_C11]|nr:HEPN domain-containing protein [Candidatus Gaiellasilicea maunaloa]
MSPRSEEFMAMALGQLEAARSSLSAGFPFQAVSSGYYASLNAARAALSEEELYAKTHRGTWDLFRQTFVAAGRFEESLLTAARKTQADREGVDYDAERVSSERAEEVVEIADRYVAAVRELVGD